MAQTVFERNVPKDSVVRSALEGSVNRPFWLDDVGVRVRFPQFCTEETSDLAIVGGGFLGLWTAILAKERHPDRRVILLEAHEVGWAASGRNGGFCEASLTHGEENGKNRWPEEYPLLESLGLQNLEEIADTVRRYDM